MLGVLEDDLKEFDVTKPFVITRKSAKPVYVIKRPIVSHKTERGYDFDSILKTFQQSSNASGLEESMQRSMSRVVQDQDDYQNFYLKYLEYFVALLVKFSSSKFSSKARHETTEAKKMEALENKIRCTVAELLKKHVSQNQTLEHSVRGVVCAVEACVGPVQVADTAGDGDAAQDAGGRTERSERKAAADC